MASMSPNVTGSSTKKSARSGRKPQTKSQKPRASPSTRGITRRSLGGRRRRRRARTRCARRRSAQPPARPVTTSGRFVRIGESRLTTQGSSRSIDDPFGTRRTRQRVDVSPRRQMRACSVGRAHRPRRRERARLHPRAHRRERRECASRPPSGVCPTAPSPWPDDEREQPRAREHGSRHEGSPRLADARHPEDGRGDQERDRPPRRCDSAGRSSSGSRRAGWRATVEGRRPRDLVKGRRGRAAAARARRGTRRRVPRRARPGSRPDR